MAVIDAGEAAHFASDAVHGFLGQENVAPRELRRRVWEQMEPFDVALIEGAVVSGRSVGAAGLGAGEGGSVASRRGAVEVDSGFILALADGSEVHAEVVVLAGGLRYRVRELPGLRELWGSKLFHCPFCHGWEIRDGRVGVIGPPASLEHLRPMLALWADELTVFSTEEGAGDDVPVAQAVRLDGDEVVVSTADGAEHRVDTLLSPPELEPVGDLPEQLGLTRIESPLASEPIGIEADVWGATPVPGVFAAGDLTGEMPSVAAAVHGGSKAGAGIVRYFAGLK